MVLPLQVALPSGFELRKYQAETAEFLAARGRAVNGDEQGLGKTPTTLIAARSTTDQPFLILAPKVALGVWDEHVRSILGLDTIVYSGGSDWRSDIPLDDGRIVIAPYSMAEEVIARRRRWPLIIADEAHIYRNRKTKVFDMMQRFRSDYFFPATGSPIVRSTLDLWAQLNLLHPNRFGSYWKFVEAWYNTTKDKFGHWEIIERPKDPVGFRQFLQQFVIRHTKIAVMDELPPKIRRRVPLEMTKVQAEFYNDLAENMLAEYGDHIIITPTALARTTRLRQVLITPALIGGPHSSAVLPALKESLEAQFDVDRPCIVFCPFTSALPYLEQAAQDAKAEHIGIIKGGMTWRALQKVIKDFQGHSSPRKVLISSLMASTSWTATAAKSAFFIGFDWTPAVDLQAEDRIHRIGQTDSVEVNYFVHAGTIEDHILEILDQKKSWADVAWDAQGMLLPLGRAA